MLSRFQNAFPSDASKAFGKRSQQPSETSRFRINVESNNHIPPFSESAINAFGKKNEKLNSEFQEDASYAFGKKTMKEESRQPYSSINDTDSNSNDWSSSALRKIHKPSLDISETEQFPSLSSLRDDMFPALGSPVSSNNKLSNKSPGSKASFVDLVKKRAEEDAKEAEEAMKLELKQREIQKKRQEEISRRKLAHIQYLEQSKSKNRDTNDYENLDDSIYPDDEQCADCDDDASEEEEEQEDNAADYDY